LTAVGDDKDEIQLGSVQVTDLTRLRAEETAEGKTNITNSTLVSRVQLSHATTVEFLRHFWNNFLSGDPSQAAGITKLVTSLRNSLTRLEDVITEVPESERESVRKSLAPLIASVERALSKYDEAVNNAK
jgi:transcription initiation factor TFIIH subunit 1